jgi:hypothetical protein
MVSGLVDESKKINQQAATFSFFYVLLIDVGQCYEESKSRLQLGKMILRRI